MANAKISINPDVGTADLSYHIATTILGGPNLNVKTCFYGKTGSSKSNNMIFTSYNTARKSAWLIDEDPDEWDKVWNYKKQIESVHPKHLLKLLRTKLPPGSVKDYDELQLGANARKWRTRENEEFNEEFQIRRTERNAIFATMQDIDDQDRQSRNQYDIYVDCGKGAKLYNLGYSFCRVRFGNLQGGNGSTGGRKLWTNTPKMNTKRYKLFIGAMAPHYILEWYESYRERAEEEWRKDKSRYEQKVKEGSIVPDTKPNRPDFIRKYKKEHPRANNDIELYIDEIYNAMMNEGYDVKRRYVAENYNRV